MNLCQHLIPKKDFYYICIVNVSPIFSFTLIGRYLNLDSMRKYYIDEL